MAFDYVSSETAKTYSTSSATRSQPLTLLWGDRVEVVEHDVARQRTRVRSRGYPNEEGYGPPAVWVKDSDLGGAPILDIYFIDVGQGDAVLIVTPDWRHILIDGGYPRRANPTGKSAADFVDWKFFVEYGRSEIALDAMIASHCDWDHYGGLADLLDPSEIVVGPAIDGDLDASGVTVENFYHAGLSRWTVNGAKSLGSQEPAKDGDGEVIVDLLENRKALVDHLEGSALPALQGEWKGFLERVRESRRTSGSPTGVSRLDASDRYLPGWTPDQGNGVTIRVLGPHLAESSSGAFGLRDLGDAAINSNGHSLLLRVDYGSARILLTGDLNKQAQQRILKDMAGQWQELAADVAKACHHGSDKIAFEFLAAIRAGATIISSGDSEGHGHPRPAAIAASAMTGHADFDSSGDLVTPLIFSTEIARSVRMGTVQGLDVPARDNNPATKVTGDRLEHTWIRYQETKSGDLRPTQHQRPWGDTKIIPGIIYGLVNVRTDGNKILCATRSEKDLGWEISTFNTRF